MSGNGDGCVISKIKIGPNTFLELKKSDEKFVNDLWQKFDKNGDGEIEPKEMLEEFDRIDDAQFNQSDKDDNGKISKSEYMHSLYTHERGIFRKCIDKYVKFYVIPKGENLGLYIQGRSTPTGSYEDLLRFRWTNITLVLLTIVQLLLYFVGDKNRFMFNHNQRDEPWRYLTYMFTHNSIGHLISNVTIQLLFGLPLEMINGYRVLVIYLAGILGGSLLQSVTYPQDDLAGASPGVYAILMAHISKIILNFREVCQPIIQLIVFGSYTSLGTIYSLIVYGNNTQHSYTSHLGGAICGFLVGISVLKNIRVKPFERIICITCLVTYIALMILLIGAEICVNVQWHTDNNATTSMNVFNEN